jgi:hypothetical protein
MMPRSMMRLSEIAVGQTPGGPGSDHGSFGLVDVQQPAAAGAAR